LPSFYSLASLLCSKEEELDRRALTGKQLLFLPSHLYHFRELFQYHSTPFSTQLL
jgi:hypothetical protein